MTCAIGLDIGGTKIAGGVVDPSGKVLHYQSVPTGASRTGVAVLTDALALVYQLIEEAGQTGNMVSGIGISICELVNAKGDITSEHTIRWMHLPVKETLDRKSTRLNSSHT